MPESTNMTLYWVIYAIWSSIGIIWIISRTLTPTATWAWCGAMIISPPLATLLYYLTAERVPTSAKAERWPSYSRIQNAIANGCGAKVTMRNRVTPLHNASNTFAMLIKDLQQAKREINIEYYILSNDKIAQTIFDILCRRARAGVRVRIIYDAIGSWGLNRQHLTKLFRSGVEIRAYGKPMFPYLTQAIHRRNHRRLVIIDAQTIYLGGINIASRYLDGGKQGFWRDEHIKIEGSVAQQAQDMFVADWVKCGGREFIPFQSAGNIRNICPVQIAWAEEGKSRNTIKNLVMEAIASARHHIRICTPYFLPTDDILAALCCAAQAGINVELLVPLTADVKLTGAASESFIRHCARQGVKIYRYRNGFMHSKTITIDDATTIIGSANLDYRSLRYNMELSAVIYNRAITTNYISRFYADVALSESPNTLPTPNLWQQFKYGLARLLAPIL